MLLLNLTDALVLRVPFPGITDSFTCLPLGFSLCCVSRLREFFFFVFEGVRGLGGGLDKDGGGGFVGGGRNRVRTTLSKREDKRRTGGSERMLP